MGIGDLGDFFTKILSQGKVISPAVPQKSDRAPRVRLTPLHLIAYQFDHDFSRIPAANISVSGIGLMRGSREFWPLPGSMVKGILHVCDSSFPLELKLVHQTGAVVGCSYENPSREVVKSIERHLNVELAAMEMVRVDESLIDPAPDGSPHWYHGQNNTELFYVENNNQVERFNLVYFANYIQGGRNQPLRFGEVVTENGMASQELVRWQKSLNAESLSAAIRFLMTIPSVPAAHRDSILRLIY